MVYLLKMGGSFHGYVSHNQMANPWLLVTSPRTSQHLQPWRQDTLSLLERRPSCRWGRQRGPGGRFWTEEWVDGWWFGTWILFSPIVGMMIQSDFHIFQGGWNHQPGGWISLWLLKKVGLSENHAGVMCRAGVFFLRGLEEWLHLLFIRVSVKIGYIPQLLMVYDHFHSLIDWSWGFLWTLSQLIIYTFDCRIKSIISPIWCFLGKWL